MQMGRAVALMHIKAELPATVPGVVCTGQLALILWAGLYISATTHLRKPEQRSK